MLKRVRATFALLLFFSDIILTELALYAASQLRPRLTLFGTELGSDGTQLYLSIYIMVAVIWSIVFLLLSVYDARRTLRAVDELQVLTMAIILSTLVFAGALYFSFRYVSRLQTVYFAVIDLGLLLGGRIMLRLGFKLVGGRNYSPIRVLVVGAGKVGCEVTHMLEQYAWTGLTLVGYLDDDPLKQSNGVMGFPVLGSLDEATRVVQEQHINEVIIALPLRAHRKLVDLALGLQGLPVNVRVVPDVSDLAFFRTTVENFSGMPFIGLQEPALDGFQRGMKRVFDLVVGIISLIVSLPVMVVIALAIKLDSPGPAIFKQRRVGEGGRLFWMYKFRSMVEDADERRDEVINTTAEGKIIHKQAGDPRVTRVGRVLRRLSLDELPQLVNVLKGEMSLVGPRPEMPWLVEQYEPWQRKRFAVPQGLTGWWQVNGRSDKPMHLHTEEDLFYIQNYSLLLDLEILWKTFGAVLKRRGAY
jgi:exopolysaccharide biosynthesis polyprenyl glycosylphosphotransferase